jgi:hypothetical protein
MIKVVHLISGLEVGGAEMMLCKLVSRMDRSQFNNVVISMKGMGPLAHKIRAQGISVYSLNLDNSFASFKGIFQLYRLLRRENPDILQTWMYHADLMGVIVGKTAGIKDIIWNIRCSYESDWVLPRRTLVIRKMCGYLSGWPQSIIANSYAGKT